MAILQCFIFFMFGLLLLIISGVLFKITDRLFGYMVLSSIISGIFMFIFAVIGYKFAVVTPLSCLISGYFGIAGFIAIVILNILF